jgi:hypothetical protein
MKTKKKKLPDFFPVFTQLSEKMSRALERGGWSGMGRSYDLLRYSVKMLRLTRCSGADVQEGRRRGTER